MVPGLGIEEGEALKKIDFTACSPVFRTDEEGCKEFYQHFHVYIKVDYWWKIFEIRIEWTGKERSSKLIGIQLFMSKDEVPQFDKVFPIFDSNNRIVGSGASVDVFEHPILFKTLAND